MSEAPNAIWYVRPPSGGQFGPATSDVMRTWVAEGRVTPDSLVWREGWRDWQEASQAFPQLGAGQAQFNFGPISPGGTSSKRTGASEKRPPSRRRSNKANAILITLLVVAMVVLLAGLIWVVTSGPGRLTDTSTGFPPDTVSALGSVQRQLGTLGRGLSSPHTVN